MAKTQVSAGLRYFLKTLRENLSPSLSHPPEAPYFPQLVVHFTVFKTSSTASLNLSLALMSCLPLPHLKDPCEAGGGDGIPAELFQILKDEAVKVLHSICQQIWKTQQWPQDWKRSVFIPISKKGNAKECSNCHTIAFISHASKVMLKILQARLQHYVNHELPDVQAGFRKGRGTKNQIAGSLKKQEFQKTSISALLTMPKPLTVWITINCGKF